MGLIPPELSLDCRPTYIPKTVSEFLGDLSTISRVSERLLKLDDFVNRLEEEMRKIDAFKRELPLCMLLLNDAIAALKEETKQSRKSKINPVLEFIPLKKNCDDDEKNEEDGRDKMKWMSSVQLWNVDQYPKINFNCKQQIPAPEPKKKTEEENHLVPDDQYQSHKTSSRTAGRAFVPFKRFSPSPASAATRKVHKELPAAGFSLLTPGMKIPVEELGSTGLCSNSGSGRTVSSSTSNVQTNLRIGQQASQHQTTRKQRRCWSPELHRRFVNALQQLGGLQVATPKQIRELMQVDGLTNDEVKSHLQKFRLHNRRLPSTNGNQAPTNQLVLGGLWTMPGDGNKYGETESLKPGSNSQSGSPQGPLQLTGNNTGGTSTTAGESMEDEEDKKSESSYSWKSHHHHHHVLQVSGIR